MHRVQISTLVALTAVLTSEGCSTSQKESAGPLDCTLASVPIHVEAKYTPAVPGTMPPMLMVTFNKVRPSSDQIDAVLRACCAKLTQTTPVTEEMLVSAWFNPAAAGSTDSDEGPLAMRDGSTQLVFRPRTGKVITMNERDGVTAKVEDSPKGEYFTKYREETTAVPPPTQYATLDVVFTKSPGEAAAYKALVTEITRVVKQQKTRMDVTAFAEVGPKGDEGAWKQITDKKGNFIDVQFDAATGTIKDHNFKVIGTIPQ